MGNLSDNECCETQPRRLERDFGRLEARVNSIDSKMGDLDKKVEMLVELAQQGRGGIRALWFAGSIIAGFLGWLSADKIIEK
jgi:hypothetical protein